MPNSNLGTVSALETKNIMKVIYDLLKKAPGMKDLLLEDVRKSGECIALFFEVGQKVKFNIIGGYDVQIPFSILYRITEKESAKKSGVIDKLNVVANFVDEVNRHRKFPVLSENDCIISLEATSTASLSDRDETGSIYEMSFAVIYKHKRT